MVAGTQAVGFEGQTYIHKYICYLSYYLFVVCFLLYLGHILHCQVKNNYVYLLAAIFFYI